MVGRPIESESPFVRLAIHILSISANSASCERLFSSYGNILTKLRNRLSTSTLSQLGEIKLHVRDEHVRSGKVKANIKRQSGVSAIDRSYDQADAQSLHSRKFKLAVEGLYARFHAYSMSNDLAGIFETNAPLQEPVCETVSEMVTDQVQNRGQDQDQDQDTNPFHSFHGIASAYSRLAEEDEKDDSGVLGVSDKWTPVSLSDLFQLDSAYWGSLYERFAATSFEDELDTYELLDQDAEGESIDDEGLDSSTGAVLVA